MGDWIRKKMSGLLMICLVLKHFQKRHFYKSPPPFLNFLRFILYLHVAVHLFVGDRGGIEFYKF